MYVYILHLYLLSIHLYTCTPIDFLLTLKLIYAHLLYVIVGVEDGEEKQKRGKQNKSMILILRNKLLEWLVPIL